MMKSVSGLGIGLSLVFGCLLLALVAEVLYLLRWRKKKSNSKRVANSEIDEEEEYNGYAKELIQLFCFKKPSSLHPNPDGNCHEQQDVELGTSKDLMLRALGGDGEFEAELMKLHNQRFLFTIKEETKEDMDSDDGKSRKGSRTPGFLTPPLASSPLKSSPLAPKLESYSSPPPKFKFLRDAEEKLRMRLMEETKTINGSAQEGSFMKFLIAAKDREQEKIQNLPISSSSSQVLPLPLTSSPAKSQSYSLEI